MDKVSIILVNYNGFDDTTECIESLKRISYDNYEIVVVDNGSENDFEKLTEKYNSTDIVLLNAKGNIGFSGGNNIGIQYAMENGTKYILLLNNDTVVEPDFLEYMVESSSDGKYAVTNKIMYAKDRDLIWHAGGDFNFKTGRMSAYGINQCDGEAWNKKKEVNFASGCCILLDTHIIEKVGLLSEQYFLYCEDTDYCLRIVEAGIKIIYEPRSKIYHKVNASTNKISGIQTYYLVRNKLYIIKQHIEPKYKAVSYIYIIAESVKRTLSGEYNFRMFKQGIRDFCKGIDGKL